MNFLHDFLKIFTAANMIFIGFKNCSLIREFRHIYPLQPIPYPLTSPSSIHGLYLDLYPNKKVKC